MSVQPNQPSFGGLGLNTIHSVFLALLPDRAAGTQLAQLTGRLRRDRLMLRSPVDPSRWHVTANHFENFYDLIPPHLVPAVGAAAESLRARPFSVTLDQIVGREAGLLLEAADGSPALKAFRQILVEALIRSGLRRYAKPVFKPHLTLSYGSNAVPRMSVEPITWTVRDFVLIESLIGTHQHIELGRWSI